MIKIIKALVFLCWLGLSMHASAQSFSLKTNLLYGATLTPNLSGEIALNSRYSLDLQAAYRPWGGIEAFDMRFWLAQPEVRYWFCETYEGHFVGLELNRKYKACCDPISSIEFTGNNDYHPQVNFYTILDGDSTWEELKKIKNVLATLFGKIEDWVFDYGLGKENIYGDNFAKFTFPSINLPNLTADNVKDVTLVPSWTCE